MQFSESLFQDDLDRLKVFYQTEGFLKVNISDSLVQFQKKNSVIVVFLIKEDKPVITQNIQFDIIDNDSSKIRAQHYLIH